MKVMDSDRRNENQPTLIEIEKSIVSYYLEENNDDTKHIKIGHCINCEYL